MGTLAAVGEGVGTGRVVAFGTAGTGHGQAGAGRGHGLVVPAEPVHARRAERALAAQGLEGVVFLHRRGAMKAQTGHAGRRAGILGQLAAVAKDHHGVTGRGLVVLDDGVAQAFLGQQPLDEGAVRFAVLHGVAARAHRRDRLAGIRGDFPGRVCGVVGEHRLDDVQHALVLEQAAVAPLPQQPQPRHHIQAVTGQAAVGAQQARLAHQAVVAAAGAVGQGGPQCERLAQHVRQHQAGVMTQRIDPQVAGIGQRRRGDETLHVQRIQRRRPLQRIQPARIGQGGRSQRGDR